jgi:hypothetical protein
MMCYRDMIFCNAPCATLSCPKKFTDTDATKAREWWGDMPGNPPVAFMDMRARCPDFTPLPPEDDT